MTRRLFLAPAVALALAGCTDPKIETAEDAQRVAAKIGRSAKARENLATAEPALARPALVEVLTDPEAKPAARAAAIELLAAGSDSTIRLPLPVAEALADPAPEVRRAAFRAVVEHGNPANRFRLDQALAAEKDAALESEMEKMLANVVVHERKYHKQQLESPITTAQDRALSIRALGHHKNEEDVDAILEHFLATNESLPRYEAIIALSRIGGTKARALVREQILSDDPFLRAASTISEAQLKDPEAIPALLDRLKNDNVFDVRIASAQALAAMRTPDAQRALTEGCANQRPKNPKVTGACNDAKASYSSL